MSPPTPDRRALGLPKAGRRRRGGILMILGVVLVALGAYLAGVARSGDDDRTQARVVDTSGGADGASDDAATDANADDHRDAGADAGADGSVTAARTTSVDIPSGHEGVALTLPFTAAGGGYVGAGDKVNLFSIEGDRPGVGDLVLGNVTVLDVSVEVAPRTQTGTPERPSTSQITYLIAVPEDEVARVVAVAQTKTVYVSLLREEPDE